MRSLIHISLLVGLLNSCNLFAASLSNGSIFLDSVIANGVSYRVRLDSCGNDWWHLETAEQNNNPGMDSAFVDGAAYVPELGLKLVLGDNLYFRSSAISTSPALNFAIDQTERETIKYQLQRMYGDLPTIINDSPEIWSTTNIPKKFFTSYKQTIRTENHLWGPTAGRGCNYSDGNGNDWVFHLGWHPNGENISGRGQAYAVRYVKNEIVSAVYQPIGGGTYCSHVANGIIAFFGHDEAGFRYDYSMASDIWLFDVNTEKWTNTHFKTAAHHMSVWDWDQDGDIDILTVNPWIGNDATLWDENKCPQPAKIILFHNTDKGFVPKDLGGNSNCWMAGAAIAPLIQNEHGVSYVLTDFGRLDYLKNTLPEFSDRMVESDSYIVSLNPDYSKITDIYHLPIPYFERKIYENIYSEYDFRSHDVGVVTGDIDGDGDIDVVVSCKLWTNTFPMTVFQILINNNGEFTDETDTRLYNHFVAGNGSHRILLEDVNKDGALDIITEDNSFEGTIAENLNAEVASWVGGTRVLINDGDGYFLTIVSEQIGNTYGTNGTTPAINSSDRLTWTDFFVAGDNQFEIINHEISFPLSTGPYGINPELWGVPGFNEFYYLRNNPDVVEAIRNGNYLTGLEHYIKVGSNRGLKIHH